MTTETQEDKRFQILYGASFNPPFQSAFIMAKSLDDVKEKIKPNILAGAFVVLKERVPEVNPNE